MRDLTYDGQSLNEKGFAVKTYPVRRIAEREMTFTSVIGRDGDVSIDNFRFKNVTETYEINSLPHRVAAENTQALINELIDWLVPLSSDYRIFTDDNNLGYFTKAICSSVGEISQSYLNKHIDTTLTFQRLPWWYSYEGQKEIELIGNKQFKIYNPEKHNSQPLIRVYGTGTVDLMVNGTDYLLKIPSAYGYIDIDSELQSVFVGLSNLNKDVDFDYLPILNSGENTIYATGYLGQSGNSVSKIKITPRWRRL